MAQKTCGNCKASKKRCDKTLPACSRCLRLSLDCVYDAERPGNSSNGHVGGRISADEKFEQIFRRLERLETLGSTPDGSATGTVVAEESLPSAPLPVPGSEQSGRAPAWATDPGLLRLDYVGFMLWGSVFRLFSDSRTTAEKIAHAYFKWTHQWLPMISLPRFEKCIRSFQDNSTNRGFALTLLAMHLVVTPLSEHSNTESLTDSPWYRSCKYYFSYFVSLDEPSVDLIQAGILIALFEHIQSIDNRARTTLGICGRLACSLEMDDTVSQALALGSEHIDADMEEAVHTWFALILLDRHFNMAPEEVPQQPIIQQKPFQLSFLERPLVTSPIFAKGEANGVQELIELEASRLVGQVHAVIREYRRKEVISLADSTPPICQDVDKAITCFKLKQENAGTFAGRMVSLSAALQLHHWYVRKKGLLDHGSMIAIISYVKQIRQIVVQFIIANGLTNEYIDGMQPAWISTTFLAVMGYKMVASTQPQDISMKVDTSPFMELLTAAATRYKLAARCVDIIYNAYCRTESHD